MPGAHCLACSAACVHALSADWPLHELVHRFCGLCLVLLTQLGCVQAMVAASEQHWNAEPPQNMQAAKYVCEAHVLAVGNANLLWVGAPVSKVLSEQQLHAHQGRALCMSGSYLQLGSGAAGRAHM